MSTTERCQSLRYFRFVAWRRTSFSSQPRAMRTRQRSARATNRSARQRCYEASKIRRGHRGSAINNCSQNDCSPNSCHRNGRVLVENGQLKLVTPTTKKRTVMPKRAKNRDLRTREYLTANEIDALMAAARQNRCGHRDASLILITFRHGLRASEAVDLRWDQVDFDRAVLHVRRVKQGTPSVHPLTGAEMRALRRLQRESKASPFMFISERGAPFTTAGFARMIERAALASGLGLKAHPH